MYYLTIFLPIIFSSMMVGFILPKVMLLSLEKRLIDVIDHRKVHTSVASRLGGVAFFPAIFLSFSLTLIITNFLTHQNCNDGTIPLATVVEGCALFIIYIVGLADDMMEVRYREKFFFQILAAALIVVSGTYIKSFHGFMGVEFVPAYVGIPISIILIVFITNAINLIDGIDGLSSLISIFALLVYGIVLDMPQTGLYSVLAFATLGALLPFSYYNLFGVRKRSNSKLFMGDTGTLVIGLILSILAIKTWNMNIEHGENSTYILAYTMLIIPCFDVVRVILHRVKKRQPIFKPDKSHFHHKLLALGFHQHYALIAIQTMNILFVVLNYVLMQYVDITAIVLCDIIIWIIIHIAISRKIANKERVNNN